LLNLKSKTMAPRDELKVAFPSGSEIPVNPSPHLFYLTTDTKVYNCMMTSIIKYQKTRAEAEVKMYTEILKCLS